MAVATHDYQIRPHQLAMLEQGMRNVFVLSGQFNGGHFLAMPGQIPRDVGPRYLAAQVLFPENGGDLHRFRFVIEESADTPEVKNVSLVLAARQPGKR